MTHAVRIAVLAMLASACAGEGETIGTQSAELVVKSQLRGYDLGPPFPAGFRDSGLVNGYSEGEWVPFVAIMEGKKLAEADGLAGSTGDGQYHASIILPTYSPRHDANAIMDLETTGTYGEGKLTPIPDPFDDNWLIEHGYSPFVLGAFADTGDVDSAPAIGEAAQRSGPTRFGGDVASVSVPIDFTAPAEATAVELRFAVRLALPQLTAISPDGQAFPGTEAGTSLGAADFFPGPGPIFVGYEVGKPTGIATVPIRVDRHSCESDAECPPGEFCGGDGECGEPCVDDSNCPTDEVCEDGTCTEPPPPCVEDEDCEGNDACYGGHCLPPCPEDGTGCSGGYDDVDSGCDPDACYDDGGDGGDSTPPCIYDTQCENGDRCEDGICQPPDSPCDMSCPEGEICDDGYCQEPPTPCDDDSDCPGGEVCESGQCYPGEPPCQGADCPECQWDADCPGGQVCDGGHCQDASPPAPCETDVDCPSGQICEGDYCDIPEPCQDDGDCPNGSVCDNTVDRCVPEHPPIPCDTAGDCPSGDECTGGFCIPPDTCQDDSDCYGGTVCDDVVQLCVPPHPPVPCDSVSDCPAGDACTGGYCQPPGPECKNDNQCPGQDVCQDGYCMPPQPSCTSNLHCASGVCDGGYCVPPHDPINCDADSDCPSGDTCAGGFCTNDSCNDDSDCPSGTVCDDTVQLCVPPHPPVPCELDADCPAGDACEGGFCVPPEDCYEDTDCGGGDVCVDNGGVELCEPGQPPTPCQVDTDCPADTCGGYDDVDCIPVCYGGYCSAGTGDCILDSDCPGGFGCTEGECIPVFDPTRCQNQYDCRGGYVCESGVCQPGGDVVECQTSSDCYGNDDVGNEQCIGGVCVDSTVDLRLCSDDSVCPSGTACTGGFCMRAEGACELDSDCSGGDSCISGWCGLRCPDDGGCGSGFTCSMSRCVPECVSYDECGTSETCWSGGCVALYAFVGQPGGDIDLWQVALPEEGDVQGGCQASGSGSSTGLGLLLLALVLGTVRRKRSRA